jgi:integrase
MGRLIWKNGRWHGEWYDLKGKRRRRSLKTADRKVAKQKLRHLELQETDPTAHKTQSLDDALDHLTDVAMPATGRAHGTISSYKQKARHLTRVLGESTKLDALSRSQIQSYITQRLREGAARGTVHKELVTLRQALKEATAQEFFRGDASAIVPTFKTDYDPKTRWLPVEELELLIHELKEHPKRQLWVMVATFSGGRDSEIESLQWENIHLDKKLLRYRTTKTRGRSFFRDVPILEQLRPWLEGFEEDSGPVVEPWSNVRRDLHKACERAEIAPCSPNDLRRTFASYMLQAGVPVFAVSRMMGHKSTRMVEQVYGQLGLNSFADAGDLVSQYVERGLAEKRAKYVSKTCSSETKSDTPDTDPENQKTLQKAKEGVSEGFGAVPRDRIELPTRGFSVPDLRVLDGGKSKKKRKKTG